MRRLNGQIDVQGGIHWQQTHEAHTLELDPAEGVKVAFSGAWPFFKGKPDRDLQTILLQNRVTWLWRSGPVWHLDLGALRRNFDFFGDLDWMEGVVRFQRETSATHRSPPLREFTIYKEEYLLDRRQKLFLSHKSADKPMVIRFHSILKTLGFDPWLDKEEMPAGTEVHRGIREGFDLSCAAIFFLTPKFKDERFLRSEINYAKDEKIRKGDRFAIITVVFAKDKDKVTVPSLLQEYIYVTPRNYLEALQEIIRALPLVLGPPTWKVRSEGEDVIEKKRSEPGLIHFKVHNANIRYMGRDSAGGSVRVKKDKAAYILSWFSVGFFNARPESVGLTDIHLVFAKGKEILLQTVPGRHTGEVRAGQTYSPDVNTLTLPSKEWLEITFESGIHSQLKQLDACDNIYLTAQTVDGESFQWAIAQGIAEAEG